MKRLVLLVVALVFALCTTVMAVEPVKVEKTTNINVPADVKAMNKGDKVEKARKEKIVNEYNTKSGKGSQNTQQEETTSSTQSTTSSTGSTSSSTKSQSKSDAAYEKCIKQGGTKKQCGK
jgi:hypothetical protein